MQNFSSRLLLRSGVEKKQPILSIAIPTYQRFDMLCEALDSVFSLDFSVPVEVIIVDNDPTNDSCALQYLHRFTHKPFEYYKNCENLGMFNNWNQCLNLARGKYITILHDDDLFTPAFANEVNMMLANENKVPDIFGFRCDLLDQRSNRPLDTRSYVQASVKNLVKKIFFKSNRCANKSAIDFFISNQFCGTLGVVMNRDTAIALEGFDSAWYPVADYEFWCRWVSMISDITIVDKKVGFYRMRENESMRKEVKEAFVSKSLLLRTKLISEGVVPKFFTRLLKYLTNVQRQSIAKDWRIDSEKSTSIFVTLNIMLSRLLAYFLPLFVSSRMAKISRVDI